MSHDDLYRPGFGHRPKKPLHETFPNMPSDVPAWGILMLNIMALLVEEVREMKQSTTDLIAATKDLVDNDAAMEKAVDDLVAAQAADDDVAVEAAVGQLKTLKANQTSHLNALAAAIPPVVSAPSDPSPAPVPAPGTAGV